MNQQAAIKHDQTDLSVFIMETEITDLGGLIQNLLPDQGCIEVQRDVPGKEHASHFHECDETLVILEGSVRFYWESGEQHCKPGSVISLPAGVQHGSVALENGATYLIAFHHAKLTHHE